ncbi:3-oxoacyl-[acyl-carrier protein] reductase [Natronocella acetinitrilica]|uniref:3-oxoacyl-[acyl-carrier protein] reductase n=1 Tax=Natronocella acetinitrilica TaxID=414046 RepID=A0AAE3G0G1_9GAMM|nr:SDR family oxidoreductase [Natronocella acetinitrilica]MCP1673074.1 3-oxoacyl-[acyl-carrier protein] reductase [Natronocella acetinitrilica]
MAECGVSGLAGARVLVTGGGKGIGAAVVRGFAQAGARLVIHCYQSRQTAESLAQSIRDEGGDAHVVSGDLRLRGETERVVAEAVAVLGGLDVLVNNAGAMVGRKPLEEIDDEFLDAVLDLNLRPVVHACRAAAAALSVTGGCIINVSSISARTGGSPGSSIYSAAKAFVSTFTRSLARELADRGVRVNAVSPGTVTTDFHREYSTPEKLENTRRAIPLQRLGTAEDCVGSFLYLASPTLSGYVTGQVLEVNGGQLLA